MPTALHSLTTTARTALLALLALGAPLAGSSHVTASPAAPGEHQLAASPEAVWPLQPRPRVLAPFREPPHRYGPGHRGADLSSVPGQAVVAPLAGTVRFAGLVAGVPVLSLVHADGRRTTYQPVVSVLTAGTAVGTGTPLGVLVPTGSHCAPLSCLHWGLYDPAADLHLDPLALLPSPRVRLLPPHGWEHR